MCKVGKLGKELIEVKKEYFLPVLLFLASCTTITVKDADLGNGITVKYVLGKVANAGQEATFRDAYDKDGKLIISHYAGGQSLAGAALNGSVAGAAVGAGTAYGLSHLKPSVNNETNNLSNEQSQKQSQLQDQTSVNVNQNTLTNTNVNKSTNVNKNIARGGQGGQGGQGGNGFNGCQSQGHSSEHNPHC